MSEKVREEWFDHPRFGRRKVPVEREVRFRILYTERAPGGHVYRPTYRDKRTGQTKRQNVWWIKYFIDGKTYCESSGSTYKRDANDLLAKRLTERGRGPTRRDLEKVTYDELAELVRADYRNKSNKSLDRLERSLRHLSAAFADWRVVEISEDVIERYKSDRRDAGASKATVNRELSALRRMLRLGKKRKRVEVVPEIDTFYEKDRIRKGFIEEAQHQSILAELPWHHAAWAEGAYITGWRARSELLTRRWEHVDEDAGFIRLERGETKNGEGRQFPITERLAALLKGQRERKRQIEHKRGLVIPWVFFQPTGKAIRDYYGPWRNACVRAGLARWTEPEARTGYVGPRPHDYRRTAVRNLNRAGVARSTAMKMVGHETEDIYKRYSIEDERSLKEGGKRLDRLHNATPKAPDRKVANLRRAGS